MRLSSVVGMSAVISSCFAAQVTISNVVPRTSTNGNIMDAHDGNVVYDGKGTYYWYAASYGSCHEPSGNSGCSGAAPNACGFQYNHNVSVFTSPDLQTWESYSPAFQMASSSLTDAILFCPKVLYNAKTKLYVMWFNWIEGANFGDSYYAVATSTTPTGPFTLVSPNVTTLAWSNTGDFSLFQDDDGTAYVIYTAHIQGYATTHQMSVERLSADYLSSEGSAGNSGFFGQSFVEAPSMFKRNGVYYAVFGECCCYCEAGNPVTVYTSANALGPYTARNVLDPSGVPAQQSNIFAWYDANGQQQFMWYGDRWQSAPDGIKGHDFTYWSALSFQPDGNVTSFGFADNFTINI